MIRTIEIRIATAMMASMMIGAPLTASADEKLDAMLKIERQVAQAGVASQNKITQLNEETEKLLSQFRIVRQQVDNIRIYNKQLEDLIGSQRREMASLQEQIERATYVEREITPLMLRMLDSLEQFVSLDVPFLPQERGERVERLRELMGRSDATTAEKFRRLLESYQIENDYGRTIEAYRAELDNKGTTRIVDFLRFGRVALVYQSLDAEEMGVWDQENRQWLDLPDQYRTSIRQGIRIARKQATVDLLKLPIAAAKPAQ
jgi:hypothetical protein